MSTLPLTRAHVVLSCVLMTRVTWYNILKNANWRSRDHRTLSKNLYTMHVFEIKAGQSFRLEIAELENVNYISLRCTEAEKSNEKDSAHTWF